jgi:predicted RecB family nuclease
VITTQIFHAYLKCPLKCWLLFTGESGSGNEYADWKQNQNDSYTKSGTEQLLKSVKCDELSVSQIVISNIKTARWKYASNIKVVHDYMESIIPVIERLPPEGRGRSSRFIPFRFIFTNNLSKDDKLLVAYDAFVLSEMLSREVDKGMLIHGTNCSRVKVKASSLRGTVRKLTSKVEALLAKKYPPDLMLNRHCAECVYQSRCRQIAIEKDELTLLAGMSGKERKKLNSVGIFTITQLSYTFRPRRHPKRLIDKREKYHHSLKALAIRENKIHIVGSPDLKIEGTPVYLDVEGLPDQDFYYLIGMRFSQGVRLIQKSLWADSLEDERGIWKEFLGILSNVEHPVLVHYGSYETTFIKTMLNRYGPSETESTEAKSLSSTVNLISVIYGCVYFPVVSNSLKEIASYCGFKWSYEMASGLQSIVWRELWETSGNVSEKAKLHDYNSDDCEAVELLSGILLGLQTSQYGTEDKSKQNFIDISKQKLPRPYGFKTDSFVIEGFEKINQAAYWNYQREKVYLKTNPELKVRKHKKISINDIIPNRTIEIKERSVCPICASQKIYLKSKSSKTVIDIKFMSGGVKKWITKYKYKRYRCFDCGKYFQSDLIGIPDSHYGRQLIAYCVYQSCELHISNEKNIESISEIFEIKLPLAMISHFKQKLASYYQNTYNSILTKLCNGKMLHIDETKIDLKANSGYVWVLTSMEDVVYVFTNTRECDYIKSLLKNLKGVLISDFYSAYDGIDCPQQKCLIHLMRDINDALYKYPYDNGLKLIAEAFRDLVQSIIETVNRFGLKCYHLKIHLPDVDCFYMLLSKFDLSSETSIKLKERIEKNRVSLFTFLKYDGIPWNNNNAEHAVKAFATLRRVITGHCTEKSLQDHLILLSISETCKYKGITFFDFLRSGEKDLNMFAMTHMRTHRTNKF